MDSFDHIKKRGERLKKMMNDSLSPERAWESMHPHHSPPKKYPTPNFLTNPDVNDPRNWSRDGGKIPEDDDEDFYDYLSDDDENDRKRKHDYEEETKDPKNKRQHDIDDENNLARIRELEKQKKIDEMRQKISQDAHHKLLVHQIDRTRTVDPFAKLPDPLVLQLYLRIRGAMYINPRDISLVHDSELKMSELNVFRNTFIQYKDFPKGNKQRTPVLWKTNSPTFNYKAYFPILVREDMLMLMSKFFFLFEVWDQVTPDKHDCVGFAKVSLG